MDRDATRTDFPILAGIFLGLGLGGFFDGIVLHQILQWHHMLTSAGYPATTLDNLQFNIVWDGLFHASTYVFVAAGLIILWRRARKQHIRWAGKLLPASVLMGFGIFNLVEGVRLHYVERGQGEALVLLHGNGSMIQDFESSGLTEMAAQKYRVIVFDRPGYGHSERPRSRIWTPGAQAEIIHEALRQLDVSRSVVMGHSWGASVAVALALRYPEAVSGLVLASGYYYPSMRADVALLSGPAITVIGDIMRYTLAP